MRLLWAAWAKLLRAGSWGRVEWVEGECWVGVDVGVGGVAGVNSQGRCAGDFLAESQHRLRERGSENPR